MRERLRGCVDVCIPAFSNLYALVACVYMCGLYSSLFTHWANHAKHVQEGVPVAPVSRQYLQENMVYAVLGVSSLALAKR